MTERIRYAVVTPAHNEAEALPRLAESLAAQTIRPESWILVENDSTDATEDVARRLAASDPSIRLVRTTAAGEGERARPIVRATQAGIAALTPPPPFVAKADADITLAPTYFEELLERLEEEPRLGIVSGTCLELDDGSWRERFGTGVSVWGAARVYRWDCLCEILPFEDRTAWDWIDVAEATALGWRTHVFRDVAFHHHRREGERARSRWSQWAAQGRSAHYLGYRPTYLLARALYRAARDPSALALVTSYAGAALRREERCSKPRVLALVRDEQRLRNLGRRASEALGSPADRR